MQFVWVCIGMIVVLGIVAAVANFFDKGKDTIETGHDCSTCSAAHDESCKLHCLMEEADKRRKSSVTKLLSFISFYLLISSSLFLFSACSTHKNNAQTRWWHAFNARYNTYFNGQQAFIEGNLEKEKGNKDNYTELIPLYPVGNKNSRDLGKGQYDRAIEKAEKTIKMHSIKAKPEWKSNKTKTAKDREWLGRREYNPFIWKAWMLLGKAQFQKGAFDEAAATFSYMSRVYQTQPMQNGLARAWLAKCYTELDWIYDAEDVIRNMNRDSVDYRTVKDWDYTYADYYVRSGDLEKAIPYLKKVIKHEKRRKQKAREWFLLGQIQRQLGNRAEAERAFKKVVGCHPPYELEFNARIAQTEVLAKGNAKSMISRLKRMAANDNNKDYLDQVYYALGNIYLAENDTVKAIAAYEKGNEKATRSGVEKGVLLLTLGNLYWQQEKYNDAQRCYGEAIGLLDKEREDYEELSNRSKVLDELVPYTDAIHLQDSLLDLSTKPLEEQLEVIDRIISELKKKEKEERRAQQEAEAERIQQENQAKGNQNQPNTPAPPTIQQGNGQWYFYNPMAVNQGKNSFQQQWGKRENVDNWQRINRTVVNLNNDNGEEAGDDLAALSDSLGLANDSISNDSIPVDTLANDPHNREYYLAQIPTTEEQKAACHEIIKDGLLHSGIIFKDKLDNLRLSEKQLLRLTGNYPDYEHLDEAWYHLFLLYSRQGRNDLADNCLSHLKAEQPESEWTILLSDPYYFENARFGEHIEDSLYTATYQAFKDDRHEVIRTNAKISEERFPLGENRAKFIFIDGLSRLNDGDGDGCIEQLKTVVEKYPQSEVSELAGMIIKGVQEGRRLHGGKFDIGDIWSRRDITLTEDSTATDTLSTERNQDFLFILTYQPDSVSENQLLYEMARYNFTNFLVRNFELVIEPAISPYGEEDDGEYHRMVISGFLSYDEALQYARQLYADKAMAERLRDCYSLIISSQNLALLGSHISYEEYEKFYEDTFLPMKISEEKLLTLPEGVEFIDPEDEGSESDKSTESNAEDEDGDDDEVMPAAPAKTTTTKKTNDFDFGDDFW
jgi:tetratricopeptide (TPR) repeat protein